MDVSMDASMDVSMDASMGPSMDVSMDASMDGRMAQEQDIGRRWGRGEAWVGGGAGQGLVLGSED